MTDPRKLPNSGIAGPGGPHDRDGVVIDSTNAILMDSCTVAEVTAGLAKNDSGYAVQLGGRINRSDDRADVMLLVNLDGMASILSEMLALAARAGVADELAARTAQRIQAMP